MDSELLTQIRQVREYLQAGHALTPVQAFSMFGTMRLAAIIHVLRHREGMNIRTTIMRNEKSSWASYTLSL